MDFQFAPWERLTSEVTDGDANFRFETSRQPEWLPLGEQCQWLVRRCGPFVWVRDRARAPSEWNHWFFCPPVADDDKPTAEYWGNFVYMLDPARVDTFVHRLWILRLNPLFVVLWHPDGGWDFTQSFLGKFGEPEPSTRWKFQPQKVGLERIPSSEVYQLLRADWTNPDSDLRQTARFAKCHETLGELERELICVSTRVETPQYLVTLMRAALRCFHPQRLGEGVTIELSARKDGRFELESAGENQENFSAFEWALLHCIVGVFEPRLLADDASMSSGLRAFGGIAFPNSFRGRMFPISVSNPSAHERLEAAHQLRLWLKENRLEGLWNFDGNF